MALACKRCGAEAIHLPIAARLVTSLTCEACGVEQHANLYISDQDQARRAAAMAIQNRVAAEAARRDGVRCSNCNATVSLPSDLGQPQFTCSHCNAVLHTQAYVAPELMMGVGIRDNMRQILAEQRAKTKRIAIFVAIGVAILLAIVVLVVVLGGPKR